jgi:uridine kinase
VKLLRARFRKSKRLAVATDKYFAIYSVTQDEAKAAQQADAMAALLIFQEDARKRPQKTTKKRTVKQLKKKQVEPATVVEPAYLPSQLSFTFEPNAVVDCLSALGIDLSIDDLEYLTRHTKDCDSNQEMHGRTVICTYAQQSFW